MWILDFINKYISASLEFFISQHYLVVLLEYQDMPWASYKWFESQHWWERGGWVKGILCWTVIHTIHISTPNGPYIYSSRVFSLSVLLSSNRRSAEVLTFLRPFLCLYPCLSGVSSALYFIPIGLLYIYYYALVGLLCLWYVNLCYCSLYI